MQDERNKHKNKQHFSKAMAAIISRTKFSGSKLEEIRTQYENQS